MSVVTDLNRTVISIKFSKEFEALLLSQPMDHLSLTHDLEAAAYQGLSKLAELEDPHDLKHVEVIKKLISQTTNYSFMNGLYFSNWKIAVSDDLLDEIDLMALTHGADLMQLGLLDTTHGTLLVLLAVTGCSSNQF